MMRTNLAAIAMALVFIAAWMGCDDDDPAQPKPNPQPTSASKVIPAVLDNTIYQEADTLSNALGEYLYTGTNVVGPDARRGLILFAIADSIPTGATIDSVSLQMNLSKASGFVTGATPTALHVVLASWGEGTSNASDGGPGGTGEGDGGFATLGDATWLDRFRGTSLWATPGGDHTPVASAVTSTTSVLGPYTWASPEMAADVQSWLDSPASNFGWLLVGDESIGGTARQFDSHDNNAPANRPRLTVHYTTVGP
ncbi:MAG TPA: DNRLRE domain-containing protein [Candidatus Krumholzibacteria bacterium]|nr:DNRLRE domain-containing protein [Candidatus Krumholzibacteria bacterium]